MSYANTNRIYYLDAMRAILMMLGIVFHSSQVFNLERIHPWIISSDKGAVLAPLISEIIHLFRMPTFFIVSGYFAYMTILKYGPKLFLKIRLTRILIPMFTTAITLNVLEHLLPMEDDWQSFNFLSYVSSKAWIGHLWFLIDLFFFFLVVFFLVFFFKKKFRIILEKLESCFLKFPMYLIVLVLPFISILVMIINHFVPLNISVLGITNFKHLILNFQFFAFGILLYKDKNILNRFSSLSPVLSISIIIFCFWFSSTELTNIHVVLNKYVNMTSVWFSASLCFYIFKRFVDVHSKLFLFLSDASYTVYLFHQVLVVGIGLLFINLGIDGDIGLIILIVIVTILSLLIHKYFILKIKLMRLLFNGRK